MVCVLQLLPLAPIGFICFSRRSCNFLSVSPFLYLVHALVFISPLSVFPFLGCSHLIKLHLAEALNTWYNKWGFKKVLKTHQRKAKEQAANCFVRVDMFSYGTLKSTKFLFKISQTQDGTYQKLERVYMLWEFCPLTCFEQGCDSAYSCK